MWSTVTHEIERPIFVVGCGRSGTTLLYQMLATHPDVGWISNYAERWPQVLWLNALSPLYRGAHDRGGLRRFLPQPSEGGKVWDLIAGAGRQVDGGPLTAEVATAAARGRAHTLLQQQLHRQRRSRFLNKNTQNTCRIGYLDALFPDCVIVHVIRNPCAVVESLLRVDWWPTLRAWPFDGTTPRAWVRSGGREEVMAATLWRRETELAIHDGNTLGQDRYIEVRYEDLVRDWARVIRSITDFTALPWSPMFERRLGTFDVRATAATRSTSLEADQLAAIAEIVEPLAGRLGYADLAPAGMDR
jgi:omega-hydroxy-beta-dihydromenaquinone-9 sulfotransferase